MGKPSAPKPPDPNKVAAAQTSQNIGTAVAQSHLNYVDQQTPYGGVRNTISHYADWTDPLSGRVHKIPKYNIEQYLSPGQQKLHDQQTQIGQNLNQIGIEQSNKLGQYLNDPIQAPDGTRPTGVDTSNVGDIQTDYGTDFSEDRRRVEEALMSRLNPDVARDRERLESRLRSQGVSLGSAAYNDAYKNFDRGVTDARMQAILAGGQEQSRLAGLEHQRASFRNTAQGQQFNQAVGLSDKANQYRDSQLQEMIGLRNQPLNEIIGLMSGTQIRDPNFIRSNAAQIANTDYAGIALGSGSLAQQAYQTDSANWQALAGGASQAGGTLGAAALLN